MHYANNWIPKNDVSNNILYNSKEMAKSEDLANKNIEKVIALCNEMLELADFGDNYRLDDGCGVVFGALRDSAYKIRTQAKKELLKHEKEKRI